jgi:hypothetical protein
MSNIYKRYLISLGMADTRAKELAVAVNQLHSAIAYLDKSNYKLFIDSFPKTKGLINAYADCEGLRKFD